MWNEPILVRMFHDKKDIFIIYEWNHDDSGEAGMSERERRTGWFWYLLLIGYLFLLARNFEPLKTINEMYSAPWYLVGSVFLISGAVGLALAFREGKLIRAKMKAQGKDRREKEVS